MRLAGFIGVLAILASALSAQDEWQEMPRVPDRVGVVKDELGFYWQLTGAASFYAMGTNTFKSANMLAIDGANFTANVGFRQGEDRHAFEQEFPKLRVRLDVWIDKERVAVRHAEILTNKTGEPVKTQIAVRTDFSYGWQNVSSNSGKPLSNGQLGTRDAGLYFRFDQNGGQSDVWILAAGEKADVRPKITTANNRQVVLAYDVTVPADGEISLVHWIGQRNVTDLEKIRDQFTPFYNRGRLVRPNLPIPQLANFEINAEAPPAAKPSNPAALVGLIRLMDKLEAERTGEELLYMSRENQLTGAIEGDPVVTLKTSFGEAKIALSEIAALRGGSGSQKRLHQVYTRDGEVLIGEGEMPTTRMSGADGWGMDLKLNELETVFFRLGAEDGAGPTNLRGYVELDDGQILAVINSDNAQLAFVTPWSEATFALQDIVSILPARAASPRSILALKDSTLLTGFTAGKELRLITHRLGEITIPASRIKAFWMHGTLGRGPGSVDDLYADWDAMADSRGPFVWVEGGSRIVGRLAQDTNLVFVADNAVTTLAVADIVSVRRTEDGILDRLPFFEFELNNGNLITGRLRNRDLKVEFQNQVWSIPLGHFLGYRKGDS
ncbi:MAG: hypothetical protein AAF585_18320 [Verrucomicrobiota bacterium]